MQCANGSFSASGASACSACSAGKYLTNATGETETDSCTSVSKHAYCASGASPNLSLDEWCVCVCSVELECSLQVARLHVLLAVLAST
jgi:hypothetical protein